MFASPKRSALLSGLLHAAAIALVLAVTGVQPPLPVPPHIKLVEPLDLAPYRPHMAAPTEGGGGGGKHALTRASLGDLSKRALRQFTPPTVVTVNDHPKLAMEAAIVANPNIELPAFNIGVLGDPHGIPGPPSDGRGTGGGIGDGKGHGVGEGDGDGAGPGPGGTGITGGGGMEGVVTPPEVLWKIEPEYTEDARRAKIQGTVVLRIEIDPRGQVGNVSVRQTLGLGLDERAIDAVRSWKFRPARRNGKPIAAAAFVEVNFRLL